MVPRTRLNITLYTHTFIVTCRQAQACYSIKLSTDTPHLTQYLCSEKLAQAECLRKSEFSTTFGQLHTDTKGRPLVKRNRPQHDRPANCYRPAVFFNSLRFITLSSAQENFNARFNSVPFFFIFFYFKNYVTSEIV